MADKSGEATSDVEFDVDDTAGNLVLVRQKVKQLDQKWIFAEKCLK